MELFSSPSHHTSHCIRIVLAEKELEVTVRDTNANDSPPDLVDLNPYQSVPTLIDRELVLYDYKVIMEYLDERFPHPPLLPPDPINRARFRMALTRINEDWYSLLQSLDSVQSEKVRKSLHDSLVAASAIFSTKPFFLSEEFSLLDCSLGPLLWRLPHYQIRLPTLATPVLDYAERIFSRRSFQHSLTAAEKKMRG